MSGHYVCCCRTCNPNDTDYPICAIHPPHGPDPGNVNPEDGTAPTEYDVYSKPFVPQPEPKKKRLIAKPDEAVE